jgi:hypothetical protein
MHLHLHHIAVLVRSLSTVADALPAELERRGVDTCPSEGTKEQYIDLVRSGRPSLLLLESIGEGPYRETLHKRGAGLHHFGLVTSSLEESVGYFSGKGLLLHPISLKTVEHRTVWMCRPGVPFLVELSEVDESHDIVPSPIGIDLPRLHAERVDWVPGVCLGRSGDSRIRIVTGTNAFHIAPRRRSRFESRPRTR